VKITRLKWLESSGNGVERSVTYINIYACAPPIDIGGHARVIDPPILQCLWLPYVDTVARVAWVTHSAIPRTIHWTSGHAQIVPGSLVTGAEGSYGFPRCYDTASFLLPHMWRTIVSRCAHDTCTSLSQLSYLRYPARLLARSLWWKLHIRIVSIHSFRSTSQNVSFSSSLILEFKL